jgi:hypothetical protein
MFPSYSLIDESNPMMIPSDSLIDESNPMVMISIQFLNSHDVLNIRSSLEFQWLRMTLKSLVETVLLVILQRMIVGRLKLLMVMT